MGERGGWMGGLVERMGERDGWEKWKGGLRGWTWGALRECAIGWMIGCIHNIC